MGCDIHVYVEYKKKTEENWNSFGQKINPGRNYFMFGLLAKGVRSENERGVEPKGCPSDMGYPANSDLYLYVTEEGGDDYASRESAERWVSNKSSVWRDKEKKFVSNPDWHSHSWLTRDEYEKQLSIYNEHPEAKNYAEPKYVAILDCMKSFERQGYESRIVFWFDN